MSLLDDLSSLDLSGIVNARGSISDSGVDLNVTLEGGAVTSVLGDLGKAIDAIENGIDNPEDLIQPLLEQLLVLAEPLKGEVPVQPWFEAVEAGIALLLEIVEAINGDPSTLAQFVSGESSNDLVRKANNLVSEYSPVSLSGLSQFRSLIEQVDGDLPTDPDALADLAISILQPFEGRGFVSLRSSLDALQDGLVDISLPDTRLAGVEVGLQAVIDAANLGDADSLAIAISNLNSIRSNTLNALRNDLSQINTRIGRLPIDQLFAPITLVGEHLQTAEDGVLEFLERWRQEINQAGVLIENADFSAISALLNTGLDHIEEAATNLFVEPIDNTVERLKNWLRNLLAHLRLAEYRNELTGFFVSITEQIESSNIDGAAIDAKRFLNDIEQAVSGDLQSAVTDSLGSLKTEIDNFLNNVVGSLEAITQEVNNISGEAISVLERIESVLITFKQTIDQITATVEQLGIEAATAQVVDTLTSLRETAEAVLDNVALPDALRPAIEQLIAEVEGIDLDTVFEPAFEVADIDLSIPSDVTDGLEQAGEAIKNLIPDELINEINAQVGELLDVVREFDPSTLLDGVTEKISEARAALLSLDPRPAVDEIRGPYQEVLDLIDQVHPDRLLAPVIEQWDNILGELSLQSPQDAIGNVASSINAAGEELAQQAVSPITQIAPEGMLEPAEEGGGEQAPGQGSTGSPEDILPVKPGDVIRMFGYLPNKLREFIEQLENSVAQSFLARLDGLGRGLAEDLSNLHDHIMGIENSVTSAWGRMLMPIGPLQFQAQLSIQANFSASEIELDASLNTVASMRPSKLRAEMNQLINDTFGQVHQVSKQLSSEAGNSMLYTITQLEKNPLFSLTQDLDTFLAALDPEPIATELDDLLAVVLRQAPLALDAAEDDLVAAARRLERIIVDLNPATQAQKFITVTEVLEEQVSLLDPRRLAAELGEIHDAIKQLFLAYDPAVFAQEIFEILEALAASLEALDPAVLLGDLADFDDVIDRVEAAVPTAALSNIDSQLEEVGARLQELNPNELIEVISQLPERIVDAVLQAVEALKAEILALLAAIKYASGNASVSVEASASFG